MSETIKTDQPALDPTKFSASLTETPGLPHTLTVVGETVGDYRVKHVALARSLHQQNKHILALEVKAELGPVENPHPDIERVFPLNYTESPAAHYYTHVAITNDNTRFTIPVEDIL